MRLQLMRRRADPMRLLAAAALALVAAGPARTAAQTGCEAKRRSCVAECRARHFAVDPRRDACIASCMAEASRCMREQGALEGKATMLLQGSTVATHVALVHGCG